MKAKEMMTRSPACCTPDDTVQRAAKLMEEHDCGCIPVVEDMATNKIVGVITDRDLACRCVGQGKGADTKVGTVMTRDPKCCGEDTDVDEVGRLMADEQVRRVPIIDSRGCCVGMIAQADIARNDRAASDRDVGRVVERISQPRS